MDVIICGGGVVGLVMANLLATNVDCKILLLEPNLPHLSFDSSNYDLRCSALNIASKKILTYLNVWEDILLHRVGIYQKMFVWDDHLHQNVTFDAKNIGHAQMGFIVENRVLAKVLFEKLLTCKNVTISRQPATNIINNPDHLSLQLDGQTINTKLLIGADGANSWVRTMLKIPQYTWDCQQSALVATVRTQHTHDNYAQQRFKTDGILAFLPLREKNLCSIVWSAHPSLTAKRLQISEREFNKALSHEFSYKLGQVEVCGARASFNLTMQHATKYADARVVLLGDAAHVVHPMAGQGLNLGLLDAAALYTALNKASDIGAKNVLHKYTQQRRWHNQSMILGLLALKRMFASKNTTTSILRGMGIRLLDKTQFAKNQIMNFACGLTEDLHELA